MTVAKKGGPMKKVRRTAQKWCGAQPRVAETLDERQVEIDALHSIYTEQITKDYHACRLDKERLILLSHLSQQQSLEVLEAHLQLARVMESNQIHVKQSVERDLMLKTGEMEKHICEMLDQNRKAIRFSLMEAAEQITPYDVEDMKRVWNLKRR